MEQKRIHRAPVSAGALSTPPIMIQSPSRSRSSRGTGTMTVAADEFIRLFLLHVLPVGFHRIRYYGFLGNRHDLIRAEIRATSL